VSGLGGAAGNAALCSKLADLGCAVGRDPLCPEVLGKIGTDHVIALDPDCIRQAGNRDAVRLCPGIACKEVP
jgi:hypothetical protein